MSRRWSGLTCATRKAAGVPRADIEAAGFYQGLPGPWIDRAYRRL